MTRLEKVQIRKLGQIKLQEMRRPFSTISSICGNLFNSLKPIFIASVSCRDLCTPLSKRGRDSVLMWKGGAIYPSGWLQNESSLFSLLQRRAPVTHLRAILFGAAAKTPRGVSNPLPTTALHGPAKAFLVIFCSCIVSDEIFVAHGAGASDIYTLAFIDWLHISLRRCANF